MKAFRFSPVFLVSAIFLLSCGSDPEPDGGGIVYGADVPYGGEVYKTVVIGTQTWMARNLNYNAEGSVCYGNDLANCAKYGRLYDWETAKTACPGGWHLPSMGEWRTLGRFASPYDNDYTGENACMTLNATYGWEYQTSEDDYGFSALPAGYMKHDGGFSMIESIGQGKIAMWWSTSDFLIAYQPCNGLNHADFSTSATSFHSVRCIKD